MKDAKAVLDRISEFHGHLGPFVVVGFRMGEALTTSRPQDLGVGNGIGVSYVVSRRECT